MLQQGILNPGLLSLLARIRHTNRLVIADWAFPFWPQIEVVDLALIQGIPTVLQVLDALQPNFKIGQVWQAEEFVDHNSAETLARFDLSLANLQGAVVTRLPHADFKALVPGVIGLVRTGDATLYGNLMIESA